MRLHIGKAALQEDVGVKADDGIYAGGLITRENNASQHKRNHVLAAQKRLSYLGSR